MPASDWLPCALPLVTSATFPFQLFNARTLLTQSLGSRVTSAFTILAVLVPPELESGIFPLQVSAVGCLQSSGEAMLSASLLQLEPWDEAQLHWSPRPLSPPSLQCKQHQQDQCKHSLCLLGSAPSARNILLLVSHREASHVISAGTLPCGQGGAPALPSRKGSALPKCSVWHIKPPCGLELNPHKGSVLSWGIMGIPLSLLCFTSLS